MAKGKTTQASPNSNTEMVSALIEAINLTKPFEKKTISNRKSKTPWHPQDGSPKLKLKRKMFHHANLIDDKRCFNEEIVLLNKIKPGTYGDGVIKVIRRKDRGIDIDYQVKTASQRLKLVNQFGITSFKTLLEFIVTEAAQPKKVENEEVEE